MSIRFLIAAPVFALVIALGLAAAPGPASAAKNLLPFVEANEAGVHVQPWFHDSFLDLAEDADEAAHTTRGPSPSAARR